MDNLINKVISDRYEILEIIGSGGMSRVYKAYDRLDDRIVALKVLKKEFMSNEEYRTRFRNESRAVALLNHQNIVKVFDVSNNNDNLQYIVMEHIEGITLREFLDKQKVLDWKEALIIVVQVLRALQHAHDKGVIHRDIKPQNILLYNQLIKVTDFGIASFKRGDIISVDTEVLGSSRYISPEQIKGKYTDERSDIYSVGVVLYEMLTGTTPFDGESDSEIARMHIENEPKKPSDINPRIPLGLEQIALRAMQKDTEYRYHSAAEFLKDLDEFRKNPDIIFDYQYFIDKNPTKYIASKDSILIPSEYPEDDTDEEIDDEYYEDDEYDDDGDDTRNSFFPILIGVAVSLCIVVGIVIFIVIGSSIGDSGSDSQESFWEKIDIFGLFSDDKIEVPNFINMKFDDILEKYPELAFENPPQYEYNSNYEDGYVCNQYPEAGDEVSKDTVFKLTVATSVEMVLVQDVSGKKSIEAESILRASGLVVELIPVVDETRDEGIVIYTEPVANKYTAYNGTVYVYYATGKNNINSTRVPNVVGYDLEAAKQKIINAGLTVGAITQGASAPSLEGFVISQTPDATTPVNSGVNVNLVIGNGIPATNTATFTISLPSLSAGATGVIKTYLNDTAYDSIPGVALDGSNYKLSFTGSGKDNSFKIFCDAVLVYTGDIDFTTTPPTFSNVHGYQFSTKEPVPNVVGMTSSEAEAALAAAGFSKVRVTTELSATVPAGVVISQSPVYSETVEYSTATIITIVVSEGSGEVPPENTTSSEGSSDPDVPGEDITSSGDVDPSVESGQEPENTVVPE